MKFRNRYGVRYPTAPGLVLDFPMSERSGSKVYDRSGKGNHGTIYGPTWTVSGTGAGINFDGENDYVDCGDGESLNITNEITIEAWINLNAGYRKGVVVRADDVYNALYLGTGTSKAGLFLIKSSGTQKGAGSTTALPMKTWVFMVGVFDGTNSFYFEDAILKGTGDYLSPPTFTDNMKIGTGAIFWGGSEGYVDGIIDEVRVYDRALGAEEIKRRYEQSKYDYLRSK